MAQSARAYVEEKDVRLETPFSYVIEVEGEASSYTTPDFSSFMGVNGPSISHTIEYISGVKSTKVLLKWTLEAKKKGKYNIKGTSVKSGDTNLKINDVNFKVTFVLPAFRNETGSRDPLIVIVDRFTTINTFEG